MHEELIAFILKIKKSHFDTISSFCTFYNEKRASYVKDLKWISLGNRGYTALLLEDLDYRHR